MFTERRIITALQAIASIPGDITKWRISAKLGYSSPSAASAIIKTLVDKGYLSKIKNHKRGWTNKETRAVIYCITERAMTVLHEQENFTDDACTILKTSRIG